MFPFSLSFRFSFSSRFSLLILFLSSFLLSPFSSSSSSLFVDAINPLCVNCVHPAVGLAGVTNGCTTTGASCLCAVGWVGPTCSVPAAAPLQCLDAAGNIQTNSQGAAFCFQHAIANASLHLVWYGQGAGYSSFMMGCALDGMTSGTDWKGIFNFPAGSGNPAWTPTLSPTAENPTVTEEFSTGYVFPTPVPSTLIYATAGYANSTWTQVQLSRYLTTTTTTTTTAATPAAGAPAVYTVPTTGTIIASYAVGASQTYAYHTMARALYLNVQTGVATAAPQVNYTTFSYIPTIIFVVLVVGFGLLFLPHVIRRFGPFRVLNMSHPFGSLGYESSVGKLVNMFSLDAVTAISEMLLVEYALLAAFTVYMVVVIGLGIQQFQNAGKNGVYVWGHVTGLVFAMSILPITRYSIFAPVFASSFERLIKFHRWLGRLAYVAMWLHFITMINLFGSGRAFEDMPLPYGQNVFTGTLSFIFLNLLIVTALVFVRRKYFEVFYYTHIALFIASFCTGLVHSLHFRYYAIGPIVLWIADRVVRAIKSHFRAATVLSAKVHVSPDTSTVTELEIDVSWMSFKPGQYVFLNVPKCSKLEWHPISISSYNSATPSILRLHVIDVRIGEWSNALAQYARRFENKLDPYLFVKVDGPHGEFQIEPEWYKAVILCGGGIGVTPMISTAMFLYDEIVNKQNPHFSNIDAVHLIFTSKQAHHLEQWFPADLNKLRSRPDKFRVHLFASGRPAQKQQAEVVRHRSTMLVPGQANPYNNNNPNGSLAVGGRVKPSVSITVSPLAAVQEIPMTHLGGPHAKLDINDKYSSSASNLGNSSSSSSSSSSGSGDEIDEDWKEYDNDKDTFTEYKMQHAAPKYWYNVKTGETSLSPPTKQQAGHGRKPTMVPPQGSRVQVTSYFSNNDLIATQAKLPDTNIQFGRPDFFKMFGELKRENPPISGLSNPACAVYMCGPVPFMDTVQAAADAHGFHTHRETFGF